MYSTHERDFHASVYVLPIVKTKQKALALNIPFYVYIQVHFTKFPKHTDIFRYPYINLMTQ